MNERAAFEPASCHHLGELKCPRCGKEELSRKEGVVDGGRVVIVVFKCFFQRNLRGRVDR